MCIRDRGCTCHFDMGSFFEKWARDVYDTQDDKGYFADTAPFRWGRRPCDPQVNTPVSLVLLMYRIYGDRRLMENCYEGMMDYLRALQMCIRDRSRGAASGYYICPGLS